MVGEVLKTARQNSRPLLGYLRKTTGGPFAPPPHRARVKGYRRKTGLRKAETNGSCNQMLLSVSASRGPVFQRYPLNGMIDHNETWAQGVSACGLIFRNITKNQNFGVLPLACNVKNGADTIQTKQFPLKGYGCQP